MNSSAPATVTVNEVFVNAAPVSSGISEVTDEDVAVVVWLSTSDIEGDVVTTVIQSVPRNGTLYQYGASEYGMRGEGREAC